MQGSLVSKLFLERLKKNVDNKLPHVKITQQLKANKYKPKN